MKMETNAIKSLLKKEMEAEKEKLTENMQEISDSM